MRSHAGGFDNADRVVAAGGTESGVEKRDVAGPNRDEVRQVDRNDIARTQAQEIADADLGLDEIGGELDFRIEHFFAQRMAPALVAFALLGLGAAVEKM